MSDALALYSLPLFPLETVLYPAGTLTLRIFEVRYLDMIGKCHKAGVPFGVVALTGGSEVRKPAAPDVDAGIGGFAPESFHPVGTLATISQFAVPHPGLITIRCTGTQRFRITRSEQLKYGLWIADVGRLPDDQPVPIPADLKNVALALQNLIASLQARATAEHQMPMQAPYLLDDCAWVANRWCELLPLPQNIRQRLMELDNPLVRLELVSDMLARNGISS